MADASSPLTHYHVTLLGAPSITTIEGSIPTSKPLVFVAALYLCLNRGRTIRRAHLAGLLWPDVEDRLRSERFRWLVAQLKQYGIRFAARASEIRLDAADVRLDVDVLARATSVEDVLAVAGGDVLQGFEPRLSDEMSRWLEDTRDAVRSNVVRSLEGWLSAALGSKDWPAAERLARVVVGIRVDHESARRALADARSLQGDIQRGMPGTRISVSVGGAASPSGIDSEPFNADGWPRGAARELAGGGRGKRLLVSPTLRRRATWYRQDQAARRSRSHCEGT